MRAKLSRSCDQMTCNSMHLICALRGTGTSGGFVPKRGLRWREELTWNWAHRGMSLALISGAVSFFLLISAIAQNELPTVIVVGHPPEISPDLETQQSLLSRYAGAATIVEPGDFTLSRGSYLSDYLRFVPGVLISAAQGSEDTQISIRGSGNLENDTIAGTELVVGTRVQKGLRFFWKLKRI